MEEKLEKYFVEIQGMLDYDERNMATIWNILIAENYDPFIVERIADKFPKLVGEILILCCTNVPYTTIKKLARGVEKKYLDYILLLLCKREITDVQLYKLFIDAGADVNKKDEDDMNCIMILLSSPSYPSMDFSDVIKYLIKSGCDINCKKRGYTPLMLAIIVADNIEYVKILLDAGADANKITSKGTALTLALTYMHENIELARILLDLKPNLDYVDKDGKTPFMLAINRIDDDDIIEKLFRNEDDLIFAFGLNLDDKKKRFLLKLHNQKIEQKIFERVWSGLCMDYAKIPTELICEVQKNI